MMIYKNECPSWVSIVIKPDLACQFGDHSIDPFTWLDFKLIRLPPDSMCFSWLCDFKYDPIKTWTSLKKFKMASFEPFYILRWRCFKLTQVNSNQPFKLVTQNVDPIKFNNFFWIHFLFDFMTTKVDMSKKATK